MQFCFKKYNIKAKEKEKKYKTTENELQTLAWVVRVHFIANIV